MSTDYIRIKWPRRKTFEVNPGGSYLSAHIQNTVYPRQCSYFSHISVESLGTHIIWCLKRWVLFQVLSSCHWSYRPEKCHWELYEYEYPSNQLIRDCWNILCSLNSDRQTLLIDMLLHAVSALTQQEAWWMLLIQHQAWASISFFSIKLIAS